MRITAETVAEALSDTGAVDRADRAQFHTTIATILLGGPAPRDHGDELLRAAEETLLPPGQVGQVDITHVEQAAAMVRRLDLRFGGILAGHIGRRLPRWALPLRAASMTAPVHVRLCTPPSRRWPARPPGRPSTPTATTPPATCGASPSSPPSPPTSPTYAHTSWPTSPPATTITPTHRQPAPDPAGRRRRTHPPRHPDHPARRTRPRLRHPRRPRPLRRTDQARPGPLHHRRPRHRTRLLGGWQPAHTDAMTAHANATDLRSARLNHALATLQTRLDTPP